MPHDQTNFSCMSSVAVAQSFSGGVAIRCVLPVLWMTRCCNVVYMARHLYSVLRYSITNEIPTKFCSTVQTIMLQLLIGVGARSAIYDYLVVNVTEWTVGVAWSADSGHLLLSDIQLVPGFTVTCNASNVHAYLLTTASVSVLRKFHVVVILNIWIGLGSLI